MARRLFAMLLAFCVIFGSLSMTAFATGTDSATEPTTEPTTAPTEEPATKPTEAPATEPTQAPTEEPTEAPTDPVVTSGSCGDDMTWSFDTASGKLTISGSGAMDDFDVQPWGRWTKEIKSVSFGENVRSIAAYAFSGCSALKTVHFSGHAPGTIGKNAFRDVTATVYYPGLDVSWTESEKKDYGGDLTWMPEVSGKGGVFGHNFVWYLEDGTLTIVGKGNMDGWASGTENPPWYVHRNEVTKVVLSGTIYCIYTGAFRDMPNLTEVKLNAGLDIIYASAFYNCTSLTKISIPDTVHTISDYAFYGCENLKSVGLPSRLKELGRNAFTNCKSLTSLSLPEGLKTINQKAFSYSGLQSLIIPEGVTKLGTGTFQGCRKLASVTLMGDVREIGKQCFAGCEALTALQLPASLKTIGEEAFLDSGLKELVFGGDMPTIGADALKGVKVAVFYPAGNTTWSESRIQVLNNTYPKTLTFYAGTPDSVVEPTKPAQPATEPATEPPTDAPTEAPTEMPTEAPTEPEAQPTEPVVTEPEQQLPQIPEQPKEQEEQSLLDYWPLAAVAVWFFGGSALAVWLILIRPKKRRR